MNTEQKIALYKWLYEDASRKHGPEHAGKIIPPIFERAVAMIGESDDEAFHIESETDKIKKGDVVRLKSGGPHMAVARANGELLDCFWFSPDGIGKHSQSFAPEIVEKVK